MLDEPGAKPRERLTPQLSSRLKVVKAQGFETMPSLQVSGVTNLSVPVFGPLGTVIAALTSPYTERLDRKDAPAINAALKLLMTGGAGNLAAPAEPQLRFGRLMRILDTHLHLIYQDRFSYPWLGNEPKLNKQWTAESYFAEAVPLEVEQAIHMEVDVAEPQMLEETVTMLGIHPRVIAAIANGRPEHANFPQYLDDLDALGGKVKSVRRLLQFQPPELSTTPTFIANVNRLPAHKLNFDICVKSHELEIARKLVAACPNVQFVLDHCGNPEDRAEGVGQLGDADGGDRGDAQCRLQGLGRAQQRQRGMDGRGPAPLRRARDRALRLGPRGVGQRPSGGDGVREPHRAGSTRRARSSPVRARTSRQSSCTATRSGSTASIEAGDREGRVRARPRPRRLSR